MEGARQGRHQVLEEQGDEQDPHPHASGEDLQDLLQSSRYVHLHICFQVSLIVCVYVCDQVFSDVELKPNAGSDRAWTWRTEDYAEEDPVVQTFAARFKDAELAASFKAQYESAGKHNSELKAKASSE